MAKANGTVNGQIPPLRDGDRMNSAEFWRRYVASPEGTKAELLNGVVYLRRRVAKTCDGKERLMPPTSNDGHGEQQFGLSGWLHQYATFTTGVVGSGPTSLHLADAEQNPEPDGLLRILPSHGGATTDVDGYIHGPPELVVEVSNTSAGTDLGVKYDLYERNGVREYIVWRTEENALDWFVLRRRRYVPITPDPADGLLKSVTFPGLWLDAGAMLRNDGRTVLTTLQRGLATPEHTLFEVGLAAEGTRRANPRRRKRR
jgi:Uma2 family endonuclease